MSGPPSGMVSMHMHGGLVLPLFSPFEEIFRLTRRIVVVQKDEVTFFRIPNLGAFSFWRTGRSPAFTQEEESLGPSCG